jgi:hypothetical protein
VAKGIEIWIRNVLESYFEEGRAKAEFALPTALVVEYMTDIAMVAFLFGWELAQVQS